MKLAMLITFASLVCASSYAQDQGLLGAINVPDKAIPAINQTLTGTWMTELRRPGAPAAQPPLPNLVVFQPEGTVVASSADGSQSSHAGVWMRVGDRRFVQTMFVFNFNESRALVSITKVRINTRLSEDGRTVRGTTEVAVLDREGRVMATIPGGTYSGVRLFPERPADFEAFQMEQ